MNRTRFALLCFLAGSLCILATTYAPLGKIKTLTRAGSLLFIAGSLLLW